MNGMDRIGEGGREREGEPSLWFSALNLVLPYREDRECFLAREAENVCSVTL